MADHEQDDFGSIAIVGMALRVPGATTPAQFWENLKQGVESTTFFDDEALRAAGVAESTLADPNYVKACGRLESADRFDAAFFDLTPREAEILDPQHRQLLECGWEALEHAGCAPDSEAMGGAGRVGVFAGVGLNGYLIHQLIGRDDLIETLGGWQITLANDKDFAATRVAYKLDLRGPAMNISTACSTSLVAVGMGCQSLLSYQSDVILAGGCSIHLPQDQGYWYHGGGTLSPDGKCRAFDINAQGTLDANGVAMLVLKRLDDARRDGDTVHAVIRGFAINNDGADKVGYTAPSVGGQAAVIREAQEMAAVDAASIGYVETHGTGTDLGDLIEVAALTEAFRAAGQGGKTGVGWCGIGSLKSNLGHLDTAAGAASLIKAVLGLQAGQIPPSLHFTAPNPKLELDTSPFYVNASLRDWPQMQGAPRRAGVSSFGIGGTNAHVVVEEAQPAPLAAQGRPWQVLPLSARGTAALAQGAQRLAAHLSITDDAFADVAHSLQTGRRPFGLRRAVVARDAASAAQLLEATTGRVFSGTRGDHAPGVVFMFPGQDSQFPGMAQTLYRDEPLFRAQVDACASILRERHGVDLPARLFSPGGEADPTYATDPLPLFVLEYSLARVWLALGVKPQAMLGYSMGEYACAVIAGVMGLDDALALAVAGAKLLALVKPGALLAVSLTTAELRPLLGPELEIAMVMAPRQCVVGGSAQAIAALEQRLAAQGAACLPSQLGLPFHTAHMDPFLAPYREELRKITLSPPRIAYVSCVSGDWITAAEATDPEHYLHLSRHAVHLAQGLERLFALPDSHLGTVLLEVGPSQTLSSLVFLQPKRPAELAAFSTLCDPRFQSAEAAEAAFPTALARLWTAGVDLRWSALYADEIRRRVPLPTYAFEHQRYWVEAAARHPVPVEKPVGKLASLDQWFHLPVWRELPPLPPLQANAARGEWLLVGGGDSGAALASRLRAAGARVRVATLDATDKAAWGVLLDELIVGGHRPEHIVYLGLLDSAAEDAALLDHGFHALIALGQSIGSRWFAESQKLSVVAQGLFACGGTVPAPAAAAVLGPLRVLPQEYPNLRCQALDIDRPAQSWQGERQFDLLAAELVGGGETALALHHGRRWREEFVPHPLTVTSPALRPGGVYLITGGLGNIGLALAKRIAQRAPGAHLLLTGRGGLPGQGDARARARRQAVDELASLGAKVRVVAADVTDAGAMAALIAAAEVDWGPLNGVIHAAGLVGQASFATVAESTREFGAAQLAPKLDGARVLETVLDARPLDFCLLCSSLSPILGGLGFAAYAAANAALDASAAAHNLRHPTRWLTVNWEGWRFADEPPPAANSAGAAVAELGLCADEGADAFERILSTPALERIVLSTADLDRRIRQWVSMDTPPAAPTAVARHARPSLMGAYVAPAGEVERTVGRFWEQLLGIDGIGAEDSFFELGGNSLLLTQLLAQIRKHFRLELSLASLFERPTIAAIAALIEAKRRAAEAADGERDEGEL